MPITVDLRETDAAAGTDNPTGDCFLCNGQRYVCAECLRPRDHCECEMGCSGELVDCGECSGTGEKANAEPVDNSAAGLAAEPVVEADSGAAAVNDDADFLREIDEAENNIARAESAWKMAKEEAKELKASYEGKVERLRKLIRARRTKLPLFDQPKPEAAAPSAAVESNGKHSPAHTGDAWRTICIDALQEFGVSESLIEKLRGKSIETLGDLADFQAKHGEFWVREIKGLGPQKAAKIADAQAAFWQKHPEYCEQPAA